DQICIGHPGYAEFDGGIFIGNGAVHTFCQIGCTTFSVPAVYSTDLMNATKEDVYVLSSGTLGISPSSRRYKEDIVDMGAASEGLLSLRPVTFRYKGPSDHGEKPIEFGLIAEEVAEVNPDLVGRDAKGE